MKPVPYQPTSPLQKPVEAVLCLLFGGVSYYLLEILWRGWSHPAMAACGALCFLFIYRLNQQRPYLSLLTRVLLSTLFITLVEFLCGCIFNLQLGQAIWDYRDMPYNLLGQICPAYSAVWFLLSFPACLICRVIRRHVFLSDV